VTRRLKWLLVGGMLLALASNAAAWQAIRQATRHEVVRCADPRGDKALRHQWAEVEQLYRDVTAGRLSRADASRRFAESYSRARVEAGPPPACLEGEP
jgi:hypothetical protein